MINNTEKYILYIGGLPAETTKQILHSAFIPFEEVKSVDIVYDNATMKAKGYGFVEFEEYDDALHAIDNMNDSELFGKVIHVTFAREQKPKEGSLKPLWETEDYNLKYKNDDNSKNNNIKPNQENSNGNNEENSNNNGNS